MQSTLCHSTLLQSRINFGDTIFPETLDIPSPLQSTNNIFEANMCWNLTLRKIFQNLTIKISIIFLKSGDLNRFALHLTKKHTVLILPVLDPQLLRLAQSHLPLLLFQAKPMVHSCTLRKRKNDLV